ncbi:MAG: SpoIIE family protein phosphatase [Alphaproteobacteria bacterium]|nr:SpoIIE family protein phosphatase [Alphaproteobacteria bacterium]
MSREGRKILVVDDEPDLERLMLQRMRREIRSGTYRFVFASNGIEAIKRLNEDNEIEMVLSDINMPEMDGLTLLEQIPKIDPNIRSVIISAYGDMKNIRTAMNRGAFDFVTKPLDFEDLKVTIKRTLRHLEMIRDALESRDKLVVLNNELEVARSMQQTVLRTEFPVFPNCQISANMEPAQSVGGDFYDVLTLPDGRVGIAVADVSGKGVPAALFMMSSRTLLKGATIGFSGGPADVLKEVNQLLCNNNETAMFVTLFFGVYNPGTGDFVYANGGHNLPLLVHADGSATTLDRTEEGIALGVLPEADYSASRIRLEPGESLVLYTDGVTEAEDEDQHQFGLERLIALFLGSPPTDAEQTNRNVFDAVREFTGAAPQFDDITCLTLYRSRDGS